MMFVFKAQGRFNDDLAGVRAGGALNKALAALLLNDMHQLVGQEFSPLPTLRLEIPRGKPQVRPEGKGLSLQCPGCCRGLAVYMYPHLAEVGPKTWFKKVPDRLGQRLAAPGQTPDGCLGAGWHAAGWGRTQSRPAD